MKHILYFLLTLSVVVSCHKHDPFPEDDEQDKPEYVLVNEYISNTMSELYLWNSKLPAEWNLMQDPFKLFDSLVYGIEDKWSYLTNDADTVEAELEGDRTTFGWALIFGNYVNSDNYYAIIQFVYKDSPAYKAGLRRGDIIVAIDGQDLTAQTTAQLYNARSLNITLGVYNDGYMDDGRTLNIEAEEMELDPIIANTILDAGSTKVGYVCLSDFFTRAEKEMDAIFDNFKREGVSELVLDLRSNPGGFVNTAVHVASLIAPAESVRKSDVFINYIWNNEQMGYLKQTDPASLTQKFLPALADKNLNLKRVFVLTGSNTASASELVMCGLMPYLDVVIIGEQTVGKYVGGSLVYPSKTFSQNWAMMLILFKYSNAALFTDFKNGLIPDYTVKDLVLGNEVYQLGDEREQLLSCALSIIKGEVHTIKTKATTNSSAIKAMESKGFRMLRKGDVGFVERPITGCGAMIHAEDLLNR